jgi:hypothetical protein
VKDFALGYNARVSAEVGTDRYQTERITLRTTNSSDWHVSMSAYQARKLARTLTKLANFLEPPKPRKAKA